MAAGSLLGTLLSQPKSYSVGMVNLLDIYPLTFGEFLEATDAALYAYYDKMEKDQPIETLFHNRLLDAYHYYLIIGGDCFKLFVFDTGLLKSMAGIDNSAILLKSDYQFKEQLTENYVLQQLKEMLPTEPRYYAIRFSQREYLANGKITNIPLYLVRKLNRLM